MEVLYKDIKITMVYIFRKREVNMGNYIRETEIDNISMGYSGT